MFNCYAHNWSSHESMCPVCPSSVHYDSTTEFSPMNISCGVEFVEKAKLDAALSELAELKAENTKYRAEMDKMQQGIPSEWSYAILQKERDELREKSAKLVEALETLLEWEKSCLPEITATFEICSNALKEYETE